MHVVGTAGHVDHGKSTLVHALTGMQPDRLPEEKRRALTVDLGFSWMTHPGKPDISVIDVPGHARFIRNMLSAVGGISACLFAVAADEGWQPQTQEHLEVLDLLGIDRGVLALTKVDRCDPELVALAEEECRDRLSGSSLEHVPIVPVAATVGLGVEELRSRLLAVLAEAEPTRDLGRPRLWVDRAFTVRGAGTVVTGTLIEGSLSRDDKVMLLPQGGRARIRSMHCHNRPVPEAGPGSRVALNLPGIDAAAASRGNQLVRSSSAIRAVRSVGVSLRVVESRNDPLTLRGAFDFHVGSARATATIRFGSLPAQGGEQAVARLDLGSPVPVAFGDRFLLRDLGRGRIAAGGRVVDVLPEKQRGGRRSALTEWEARRELGWHELITHLLRQRRAVVLSDLSNEVGFGPAVISGFIDSLVTADEVVRLPDVVIRTDAWRKAAQVSVHYIHEFCRRHPLEWGVPPEDVVRQLDFPDSISRALLEHLVEVGSVARKDALYGLPGTRPELPPEHRNRGDELARLLAQCGYQPPTVDELVDRGYPRALIKTLVANGELEQIHPTIVLAKGQVDSALEVLTQCVDRAGPITVAAARDALGSTRKYILPLLYYMDAAGLTIRTGDSRVVRSPRRAQA